jgi:hypothetical protein
MAKAEGQPRLRHLQTLQQQLYPVHKSICLGPTTLTTRRNLRVERKTTGDFVEIATLDPNITSYSDLNVVHGTYTYVVKAWDNSKSSSSDPVAATIPQVPPAAPTGLTATAAVSGIQINLILD